MGGLPSPLHVLKSNDAFISVCLIFKESHMDSVTQIVINYQAGKYWNTNRLHIKRTKKSTTKKINFEEQR